jgi:exonuclease 3'-5' domain-containing protein 1
MSHPLFQKNGRRTIHDLSCQFGARGFTEEMREAVGTTQEGLTEFLLQHPSLFVIDSDQVALRGYGDLTAKNNPLLNANGRHRDYEAEAVQFFVHKLTKFGPELQVIPFCPM